MKTLRQQRGKSPSEAWDIFQDKDEQEIFAPLLLQHNIRKTASRESSRDREQAEGNNPNPMLELLERINFRLDSMDSRFDRIESKTDQLEVVVQNPSTASQQNHQEENIINEEEFGLEGQFSEDSDDELQLYAQSHVSRNLSVRDEDSSMMPPPSISHGSNTLKELYPLPEGALLVGNTILWKDHSFNDKDVLVVQKPGPNPTMSFKVLKSAQMTEELLDLISAAKEVPIIPLSQAQNFNKAFKFLDGKLAETTGWHTPNSKSFSVRVDQFSLETDLKELAKDILTCKKGTPRTIAKFDLSRTWK